MKLKNHNVFLFAFVFVHNVFGAYNAPSSNSGSAYSTSPGVILDKNGTIVGHSTSTGGDVYFGSNQTQGEVYRVSSNEKVVFDSNGKNGRVLTPNKNGDLCYDTTKLPNKNQIPRDFEAPICAKTMDDAVLQTNPMFDNACNNKVEEAIYSKETNGGKNSIVKLFKRGDNGDGNEKEVKIHFNGDKVSMISHNHIDGSLWPSEADVITALGNNSDISIYNCNGENSVFSVLDENVYKIEDGKRVPFKEEFPGHVRSDDGHDPYDPQNLETLRAKAKGLEGKNKELGAVVNNKNGPNGHKWVMRGEQPISFDNIVFGSLHRGKKRDEFSIKLEQPYFIFDTVWVSVEGGHIRSIFLERGFQGRNPVPSQKSEESMVIGELIRKDIEKQCGVKLNSDGRRCHRTYEWCGSGFCRINLIISNENDSSPGNASFFLTVDGGCNSSGD